MVCKTIPHSDKLTSGEGHPTCHFCCFPSPAFFLAVAGLPRSSKPVKIAEDFEFKLLSEMQRSGSGGEENQLMLPVRKIPMSEKMVIRGLIFDCDGLMFDSELPAYQFWQAICEEYGCSLSVETWSACIGGSTTDFDPWQYLEAQGKQPVHRDEVQARMQALDAELLTSLPLLPGVLDYLEEAKRLGLKLGVASNSDRPWVLGLLTQQGITAYFDCLMCREEGIQPKPHPELYHRVLAALELQPEEAVALEDSLNGIRAAKAAGLFCVAVPTALSCQLPLDHADMRLTSLQEMPLASLLALVQASKLER